MFIYFLQISGTGCCLPMLLIKHLIHHFALQNGPPSPSRGRSISGGASTKPCLAPFEMFAHSPRRLFGVAVATAAGRRLPAPFRCRRLPAGACLLPVRSSRRRSRRRRKALRGQAPLGYDFCGKAMPRPPRPPRQSTGLSS